MDPRLPATRTVVTLDAHGDPDVMRLVEEPLPPRRPGEVAIAVEAIGVNFGDTLVRRGAYRRDAPLSFRPGFELAGRVLAGPDGLPPGTPVAAFTDDGGYASVVSVASERVFPLPDGLATADAAALLIQGTTAWFAVHRYGRVAAGEHVLVHAAAGGVGSIAVQLARRGGARPIAVASTEPKRELALARGAEVALAPDPDLLRDLLREHTAGHGVDVVLDGVGGALFEPSFGALAVGGRYVAFGAASREPSLLDLRRLMPRAIEVSGFVLARMAALDGAEPARAFARVADAFRQGAIQVERVTLPFERIADAHRLIESRTHIGKIVVTVP